MQAQIWAATLLITRPSHSIILNLYGLFKFDTSSITTSSPCSSSQAVACSSCKAPHQCPVAAFPTNLSRSSVRIQCNTVSSMSLPRKRLGRDENGSASYGTNWRIRDRRQGEVACCFGIYRIAPIKPQSGRRLRRRKKRSRRKTYDVRLLHRKKFGIPFLKYAELTNIPFPIDTGY